MPAAPWLILMMPPKVFQGNLQRPRGEYELGNMGRQLHGDGRLDYLQQARHKGTQTQDVCPRLRKQGLTEYRKTQK